MHIIKLPQINSATDNGLRLLTAHFFIFSIMSSEADDTPPTVICNSGQPTYGSSLPALVPTHYVPNLSILGPRRMLILLLTGSESWLRSFRSPRYLRYIPVQDSRPLIDVQHYRVGLHSRPVPLLSCAAAAFLCFTGMNNCHLFAWSLTRELCYTIYLSLPSSSFPCWLLGYVAVAFLLGRDQSMGMFERK
ncbi:hypothetical protein GGR53DRAFT_444861 [Hypoxylon sp. FL1150]|nr:hypothetical protein GGR53DRAFT_444861 [Hypoxylon sp. FL1150]